MNQLALSIVGGQHVLELQLLVVSHVPSPSLPFLTLLSSLSNSSPIIHSLSLFSFSFTLPFPSLTSPCLLPFPFPSTPLNSSSSSFSLPFLSPLFLSASLDYIPEAFQNSQVSFADFCSDLTLLNNPNLVVRVAGR